MTQLLGHLKSLQGENSLILESFFKSLNKKTSKPLKTPKYFKSVLMYNDPEWYILRLEKNKILRFNFINLN